MNPTKIAACGGLYMAALMSIALLGLTSELMGWTELEQFLRSLMMPLLIFPLIPVLIGMVVFVVFICIKELKK